MEVRVGLQRKLSAKEFMLLNCGVGEDSWESLGLQGDPTGQSWSLEYSLEGLMLKLKLYCFGPLMRRTDSLEKDPDAGKDWRQEKGVTEDEMVGWHHRLDGHEFEQALRVGERQGSLECCSPWGHKEADTTEQLNWTEPYGKLYENWQVTFLHLQLGASGTVLSLSFWLHWAVHLTQPCIPEKGLERKSRHCCHSIYQSKVFQHRYTF